MGRKRRLASVILAVLLLAALLPLPARAAGGTASGGKIINVVYDDSGSMVRSGGQLTPRWSQAKYAMEVFCAMMGEQDVMNIFPMSKEGGLGLTLRGSDANRVAQVHDMNAKYSNTPFQTVTSAASNLLSADGAYEKWLVIITDGAFDDGSTPTATVQSRLDEYNAKGIRTVYLGIGDSAAVLQSDPGRGAYAERAANGGEVLAKVTSIANQIFEHQVLGQKYIQENAGQTKLSIDIPTGQIVVFAQGDNVSVGSLSLNGKPIGATAVEHVKCSDVLPLNYPSAVRDTSLNGVVATFEAGSTPFERGEFSIAVTGARTVEYYYRPGVTVNCDLLYNGHAVQSGDELYAGGYEIALNFVDPLLGEAVQSELLSDASFTLTATNNGQDQTVTDARGSVNLAEGEVRIRAVAELPGHVFLTSSHSYTVLPEPIQLNLEFDPQTASYTPDAFGENAVPVLLRVTNGETGAPLSAEESAAVKLLISDQGGVTWSAVPAAEAGTWELRPLSADGSIASVEAGSCSFDVSASYQLGPQYAYGAGSFGVTVEAYTGNGLRIEIGDPEQPYSVGSLKDAAGMPVTVLAEDPQTGEYAPMSEELWQAVELKVAEGDRVGWTLERGSEPSTWVLTPGYFANDPLMTASGDVSLRIAGEGTLGELNYAGEGTKTVSIAPMSVKELLPILIPRLLLLLFLLWLIIGYIRKNRIHTRGMKPHCIYKRDHSSKRRIKKSFLSVILPYVPEKATVYCHKSEYQCNFPNLRIKAAGRRSFYIINKGINLRTVKFNGEIIPSMQELAKRRFSYGGFEIASIDPTTRKELGKFVFR